MSSSVAPAMRMRVPASEISLRALGSVHRLSPVLSGVLTTAGAHSLCSLSWKETVPLGKARRPTRPRGSLCAWAARDQRVCPFLASLLGFACHRLERRTALAVPGWRFEQGGEKMILPDPHKLIGFAGNRLECRMLSQFRPHDLSRG